LNFGWKAENKKVQNPILHMMIETLLMNMPIYMDWDENSRRCYSRILVLYVVIAILTAVGYVVRLLDVLTLVFAALSLVAIVLVTTAYMIRRNPPLESPEFEE
jgi:hypothetical protein